MSRGAHTPTRSCIACRRSAPKEQLVRFVRAPDGRVTVDYRQRLPGRGTYTCVDPQCVRNALRSKAFQRAFKAPCTVPEADCCKAQLIDQIRRRILNLIGMARKAGQTVSGSEAVLKACSQGRELAAVLLAEDISDAVAAKLAAAAAARRLVVERMFDKEILGQTQGRARRSVVALASGPLADAILTELDRYKQLLREN